MYLMKNNYNFILLVISLFANESKEIDFYQKQIGNTDLVIHLFWWTIENNDQTLWEKIEFPCNPPNRNNQTNIWFRVKLPDALPNDPYFLYIVSTDLIIIKFIMRVNKFYHFGEFDKEGKGNLKLAFSFDFFTKW